MKILLTNDDSRSSPLLAFAIDKLKTMGELIVVVPAHEQSWRGKSITRFDPLHQEKIVLHDYPAFAIDGTPADCVNIGVYHLCGGKPDLVVSGINLGLNAGLGFLYSSGTLGACFEANIAGLPAVALSQAFDSETMNRYMADYAIPEVTLRHLRVQTAELLDRVFKAFAACENFLTEALTWSVNFPFQAGDACDLKIARAGFSLYGSCFRRSGSSYEHSLKDVYVDPDPDCDARVLAAGNVTITPIDIRVLGQLGGGHVARMMRAIGR